MENKSKVAWKQLTVRIPLEVHRALNRAAEEGRAVAVIIESLAVNTWSAESGHEVARPPPSRAGPALPGYIRMA